MDVDRIRLEQEPGRHRFLTWYLPYFLLAGVAFFWPADSAFLGLDFRTLGWVQSIPSIAGYIEKSQFPSATAAYFVLTGVTFMPLFVLVMVRPEVAYPTRDRMRSAALKFRRQRPYLMLLAIGVGVCGVVIAWVQPGYEYGVVPISTQRWALAVAGPFFSFFPLSYVVIFMAAVGVRFSFFVPLVEV